MKDLEYRQALSGPRSIGPLGTATRILVGLLLLSIGIIYAASGRSFWWQLALGLLGFPAVLTLAQLGRLTLTKMRLLETGYLATGINCAALELVATRTSGRW